MKKDIKQFFGKFGQLFTSLKLKKINWKLLISIGALTVFVFVLIGCRVIPSMLANNVYSITAAEGNIDSLSPGDMINYNINGYSNWRILTVDKENGTVEVTSDSNVYNLTVDPNKSDEEIKAIYQAEADKFLDDRYVIKARTISKADSLLFDTKGEYWVSEINENSLMTNKTGDQETTTILRTNSKLDKIYVFPYIELDVRTSEIPNRGTEREYSSNGINTWVYSGSNSYVNSTTRRLKYFSKYPVGLDVSDVNDIIQVVRNYYSSFNSSGLRGYGNYHPNDVYSTLGYSLSYLVDNPDYFNGNEKIYFYSGSFSGNNVNYYSSNGCQEKKYYIACGGPSISMLYSNEKYESWSSDLTFNKSKILTFGYRPVLTLRISDKSDGKSTSETLKIGDNVKYEANGYRNWKVLSINKNEGTVDVISGGIVKNISLYGRENYDNYEDILQNEVNSYINGDIAIGARTVEESDIKKLNKINDNVAAMYWYNAKNVTNRVSNLNANENSSNSSNYVNSYEVGIIWTNTGDYYVNDINNSVASSNINKCWIQLYSDGGNYGLFYYVGRGELNYIAGLRPIITLKYDSVKKLSNTQARKIDQTSKDYDNYYAIEQSSNNENDDVSALLFREAGEELDVKNKNNTPKSEYENLNVAVGETNNVLNLAIILAIVYALIMTGLVIFVSNYRKKLINK